MENKYQRGKIYKLVVDDVYYGSTTETRLCRRLAKHRSNYKCWKEGKKTILQVMK